MPSPESVVRDWRSGAASADAALAEGHASALRTLRRLTEADIAWPAKGSLYVLRNYTVEPLQEYVRLAGYRRGVDVRVELSGYDAAELAVRDPDSPLRRQRHDVVLLALWLDEMREAFDSRGALDPEAASR